MSIGAEKMGEAAGEMLGVFGLGHNVSMVAEDLVVAFGAAHFRRG